MAKTMDEIELYRKIISKDPCSQAFVYLAEALWEGKMYIEAIETCVNGLRLHPHDLRARVILGLSYLRTGELDLAETELLKAEEMLEINSITYQALADVYDQKGETDQASRYRQMFETIFSPVEAEAAEAEIESLSEKVEQEDGEVATVTMAELYVKQGHLEEAIEVYRRILRRDPETEGVIDKLTELEDKVSKAKTARTLLSILESWQNKLREAATAETASPPAKPVGIDPEKLAAIAQNYVKLQRSS